eukprot:2582369-Rhodomonas_salina.1
MKVKGCPKPENIHTHFLAEVGIKSGIATPAVPRYPGTSTRVRDANPYAYPGIRISGHWVPGNSAVRVHPYAQIGIFKNYYLMASSELEGFARTRRRRIE